MECKLTYIFERQDRRFEYGVIQEEGFTFTFSTEEKRSEFISSFFDGSDKKQEILKKLERGESYWPDEISKYSCYERLLDCKYDPKMFDEDPEEIE